MGKEITWRETINNGGAAGACRERVLYRYNYELNNHQLRAILRVFEITMEATPPTTIRHIAVFPCPLFPCLVSVANRSG